MVLYPSARKVEMGLESETYYSNSDNTTPTTTATITSGTPGMHTPADIKNPRCRSMKNSCEPCYSGGAGSQSPLGIGSSLVACPCVSARQVSVRLYSSSMGHLIDLQTMHLFFKDSLHCIIDFVHLPSVILDIAQRQVQNKKLFCLHLLFS
jgi:hypothetical protein